MIQAADQALQARDKQIQSLSALRLQLESDKNDLRVRLAERDKALSSPLHSPLVTTVIGILAGGLLFSLLVK